MAPDLDCSRTLVQVGVDGPGPQVADPGDSEDVLEVILEVVLEVVLEVDGEVEGAGPKAGCLELEPGT